MSDLRKECPLCGGAMRLVRREAIDRIPGSTENVRRQVREWVCQECDYFEEIGEGNPQA